jgi:predicted DNA-binding protein
MTITVNLPPATIEQLEAEAAATGKDVEKLVREAVETKLARRKQTFAEVLKPIHDAVDESGMSEEEVQALLGKELKAVRKDRRSSQGKP